MGGDDYVWVHIAHFLSCEASIVVNMLKMIEKAGDTIEFLFLNSVSQINNGVYLCGFAGSQEAYNDAVRGLFDGLDKVCRQNNG